MRGEGNREQKLLVGVGLEGGCAGAQGGEAKAIAAEQEDSLGIRRRIEESRGIAAKLR